MESGFRLCEIVGFGSLGCCLSASASVSSKSDVQALGTRCFRGSWAWPALPTNFGWPGLLHRTCTPAHAPVGCSRLRSEGLALCSGAEALDPGMKGVAYF